MLNAGQTDAYLGFAHIAIGGKASSSIKPEVASNAVYSTVRFIYTANVPAKRLTYVPSGGSYSIYYALAVASKELDVDHRSVTSCAGSRDCRLFLICVLYRPDFTNTEPATRIGPFSQWGDRHKIVAMDPWGHLTPWTFKDMMEHEQSDYAQHLA
jgi:hypothetical protein